MGIIQRMLSKYVDPQPEVVELPENDHVQVVDGKSLIIEGNFVKRYEPALLYPQELLKEDFENEHLKCLVEGEYQASRITFKRNEANELYIESFRGTWKKGNLKCSEFAGHFEGGTLNGVYINAPGTEFKLHPAVSVTGEIGGSYEFSTEEIKKFIRGEFVPSQEKINNLTKSKNASSNSLTSKNVANVAYKQFNESDTSFKDHNKESASKVIRERIQRQVNQSLFGIKPIDPCVINNCTTNKSISLLALNSGQVVTFKDEDDRQFSFEVVKSYKDDGKVIHLKELSHSRNEVRLTWNNFRKSTTSDYDAKAFDARSQVVIGHNLHIPTLFENHILGKVKEAIVSNEIPEISYPETDVENNFEPKKLKI